MDTVTSTYTTPPVPHGDFDDFRPGKHLDTVAQTTAWIADTYNATVTAAVATDGVRFTATGDQADIDRLVGLYH